MNGCTRKLFRITVGKQLGQSRAQSSFAHKVGTKHEDTAKISYQRAEFGRLVHKEEILLADGIPIRNAKRKLAKLIRK